MRLIKYTPQCGCVLPKSAETGSRTRCARMSAATKLLCGAMPQQGARAVSSSLMRCKAKRKGAAQVSHVTCHMSHVTCHMSHVNLISTTHHTCRRCRTHHVCCVHVCHIAVIKWPPFHIFFQSHIAALRQAQGQAGPCLLCDTLPVVPAMESTMDGRGWTLKKRTRSAVA